MSSRTVLELLDLPFPDQHPRRYALSRWTASSRNIHELVVSIPVLAWPPAP